MQGLLLKEYNRLEMAELPVPQPAPDEVLVRVAACGICGSDVHGYDGTSGRRIPPLVMGHEAAGEIVAVGAAVQGWQKGDRVTFDSTVYCGRCFFCTRGEVNLCDNREIIGVACKEFRRAGAFAEFVSVPARILYRLPESLPFAHAAMVEAVAVALHALRVSAMQQGESVLVLGAGMIGLLLLQAARAAGAAHVLVTDVDASRLALAKQLGADDTIQGSGASVVQQVLDRTAGRGVDAVLEAVGRAETVAIAVACARKGGTVTLVGNLASEVPLPLQSVVTRQIRLQGSCASAGEYPEAMRLMADGIIRVEPLISAVVPVEEGPQWFARLHAREAGLMKVVLDPRPDREKHSGDQGRHSDE